MKIKENTTIYQCDFCNRKMFKKHAMIAHELWCNSNPENFRACSGCKYLEEKQVEYSYNIPTVGQGLGIIFDGKTITKKTTGFRCNKLNKDIYPFKAEKLNLPYKYPETFEGQEPMPKICEHYNSSWEND